MQETRLRLHLALGAARMSTWDATVVDSKVTDGIVSWSPDGAALIGLAPVEQQQHYLDFLARVHPDERAHLVQYMQLRVDQGAPYHCEYRVLMPDGMVRWIGCRGMAVYEDGIPVRTLGLIWDDSPRKQQEAELAEQKELAEVTLGSIGDGVIATDARGRVRFMNRVAEELTSWNGEQAAGIDVAHVVRLLDEADGSEMENPVHRCLRERHAVGVSSHAQLLARDGRRMAIEDSSAPIWGRDGTVLGAVVVLHDVTHERKLAHQLSWQASHDPLTGLINRRAFEVAVADALRSAKDHGHHHALLYMDLDRFKIVNDTCGHGAGDLLLQTLSQLLQRRMRESDVLARLGGDEMGVILSFCPLPRALALADELRQAVKDFRFVWGERVFEIGVSIGMVEISEHSKSMTELLIAADQACYMAKEQGRNRVHVYRESDAMLARRQGELHWVSRLTEALEKNQFRLFSQPIVALNGSVNGAANGHAAGHQEVLLRIAGAGRLDPGASGDGLILPGAFIPAAERYDLIVPLDRWVVTHVCRHIQAERRRADGSRKAQLYAPMYSVNLSGSSLGDDGMLAHIQSEIAAHGIDPGQLCFEITETAVIANLPKAQEFIASLRALGCHFSLDDFGSGLSSFAYLRTLPVDYLKIDGLFIRGIAGNDINRALVKAINEVGHVMGIRTVAEYVEDTETLAAVRALGIDYAQGYAVGQLRQLS
ncbi:EAL domain-containing protein [Herbaspirillum sp. SJZ107]|uniref:EAL domain-containing protein n=1 Tax=Herbaspirillum sp. SJZ107 TaxID=2572881 RepID=UPI0011548D31|nr:EAL domain-containing protein [Herbaspirillum sp. SJZ107]TQK05411.1 diguanylate cyclase/phosphodiesterase with PAS/PAC sensor(s) [Herbaspirillum sp. SJZ107]